MKKPLIFCLYLLGATLVQAQTDATADTEQAERNRIQSERTQIQQRFDKEEANCYQRFAVNDCRDANRVQRRDLMADLRRQEILLNDAVRKRKGAEQLQRMEQKAAEESPPANASPADKSGGTVRTPTPVQPRQPHTAAQAAEEQAARKAKLDSKRKAFEETQAARKRKAATATEERERYLRKQQDAAEHAEQTRKRNAEDTKTPAAPLPP
jgi:hypothetical protein